LFCYALHSLTRLFLKLDDILQKKQQQVVANDVAIAIKILKTNVMCVIACLDAMEEVWQRVLPITDYLYSLKLYIYNPILELLETKEGINNIESLKDSDNIYTKLDDAVATYQRLKTKAYSKYRSSTHTFICMSSTHLHFITATILKD